MLVALILVAMAIPGSSVTMTTSGDYTVSEDHLLLYKGKVVKQVHFSRHAAKRDVIKTKRDVIKTTTGVSMTTHAVTIRQHLTSP